jgi:hypothetical protein
MKSYLLRLVLDVEDQRAQVIVELYDAIGYTG